MKLTYFKKTVLIFVLFVSFIFFFSFCLAQEKELEIDYPTVPGVKTPTSIVTPLPEYVEYIFYLALIVAALVIFGALIYGGVRYLIAAGNPVAISDAKDQIFSALLGMIILLSSYLILTTINPQLIVMDPKLISEDVGVKLINSEGEAKIYKMSDGDLSDFMPGGGSDQAYLEFISLPDDLDVYVYSKEGFDGNELKVEDSIFLSFYPLSIKLQWKPYGVYLCKGNCSDKEYCAPYDNSSASIDSEVDKINCIYAKQYPDTTYRIVLHKDEGYQGKCWYYETNAVGELVDVMGYGNLNPGGYNIDASSINIYRAATHNLGSGVTLFAVKNYNKECGAGCEKNFNCPCGDKCDPEGWGTISWEPGKCWGGGDYKDITVEIPGAQGNSILIDPDRAYMAVLFDDENYNTECEVFIASDPFLEDNYISRCDAPGWFTGNEGCFKALIVKPIK